MKTKKIFINYIVLIMFSIFFSLNQINAQALIDNPALDKKVQKFLDEHAGKWHDLNVPGADARLSDAHDLVKKLKGPFDLIFSDADKEWYKNYFIELSPKLVVGGCFTAH